MKLGMWTWMGAALLLAGCMAAPEEETFDEGSDDEEATAEAIAEAKRTEGPLGVNGMDPVDFSNEAFKFGVNYFIYGLTR